MTDIPAQTTSENNAELEAVADQLLADMNRITMRSQNYDLDIERLKAETSLLKAETSLLKAEAGRLETENRVTLARIKAVL